MSTAKIIVLGERWLRAAGEDDGADEFHALTKLFDEVAELPVEEIRAFFLEIDALVNGITLGVENGGCTVESGLEAAFDLYPRFDGSSFPAYKRIVALIDPF